MTDLRDLLNDAVTDVEPGYGLDDIRARTTTTRRWPHALGGAVLAVAASVVAFAVLSPDNAPRATDPGAPANETPSMTGPSSTVSVYYVGDTPDGPRLYREFVDVVGNPLERAVELAMTGDPRDPDYFRAWPDSGGGLAGVEISDGMIRIEVEDGALADYDWPDGVGEMAIQQVIYTAQEAVGERLPVQFVHDGNPVAQVLSQPTSEPLAAGAVLETLTHVSLTTPAEGATVDNDDPFIVGGVGSSANGAIFTTITDPSGRVVVDQRPTIVGDYEQKLFPFEVELDLSDVPPGDYAVVSQTDDPSGRGRFHTDDRTIAVVE